MKRIITLAIIALLGACALPVESSAATMTEVSAKPKTPLQTVTFSASIHCKACQKKVEENLSFEKGVKALEVSVENKTIKVTFDPSKTSIETLKAAIRKLGYTAEVLK